MPDHLHAVVEGQRDDADLKKFVSRAKQYSGYAYSQACGEKLWQRYGYEHVLRDSESTRSVVLYILENPLRAGLVQSIAEYPFIGSGLYSREALIEYACYGRGGTCQSEWERSG
jgi:putative transposase